MKNFYTSYDRFIYPYKVVLMKDDDQIWWNSETEIIENWLVESNIMYKCHVPRFNIFELYFTNKDDAAYFKLRFM